MTLLTLAFEDDLRFFLAPAQRHAPFELDVDGSPSIKDVIESLGVPHTELAIILVNQVSVPYSYLVGDGDQVEAYSVRTGTALGLGEPLYHLQPQNPTEARFVLDVHLGRLAAYLRMLGFDTLYQNHCDDEVLAQISSTERRILLTRDIGLLKRSIVVYGYFVRHTNPVEQLEEVIHRYALSSQLEPFKRCIRCNGMLELVPKTAIAGEVPENITRTYETFQRCRSCRQIYWKGTHFQRMQSLTERILARSSGTAP
jgi:uncharacterized protein with PIN domain